MINLFCIRWKKEACSSVVKKMNGCGGVVVLVLDGMMFEVARVSSLSSSTLLAKTAVSSLIVILV